jgi:hypothetical protein
MTDRQDWERMTAPYHGRLNDVFIGTEADFNRYFPDGRNLLSAGTIAGIRHNLMARRVFSAFIGNSEIIPKTHCQRLLLVHKDFTIRFNKADKNLRVRRNKTTQSAQLDGQKQLDLFADMPAPPPHFAAVYMLDQLGVEMEATHLTYQAGRAVEWSTPLNNRDAAIGLATLRPKQPAPQSPVKVRVKRQPTNNEEAEVAHDGDVRGSSSS